METKKLTIRKTAPSNTAFILTSRSIGTVNKYNHQTGVWVRHTALICVNVNDNNNNSDNNSTNNNKSIQSNLGRGPHRGTVAHLRRKVPIGYSGSPQIRPQKYPFPWTDPQTPLPASSLDPSDLWRQTASRSDAPLFNNALDRPTHRPSDHTRESLITIGRYASNESDAVWVIVFLSVSPWVCIVHVTNLSA